MLDSDISTLDFIKNELLSDSLGLYNAGMCGCFYRRLWCGIDGVWGCSEGNLWLSRPAFKGGNDSRNLEAWRGCCTTVLAEFIALKFAEFLLVGGRSLTIVVLLDSPTVVL